MLQPDFHHNIARMKSMIPQPGPPFQILFSFSLVNGKSRKLCKRNQPLAKSVRRGSKKMPARRCSSAIDALWLGCSSYTISHCVGGRCKANARLMLFKFIETKLNCSELKGQRQSKKPSAMYEHNNLKCGTPFGCESSLGCALNQIWVKGPPRKI